MSHNMIITIVVRWCRDVLHREDGEIWSDRPISVTRRCRANAGSALLETGFSNSLRADGLHHPFSPMWGNSRIIDFRVK
jgi:hypothetical protein